MISAFEQHALNEFKAAGWMDEFGVYLADEDGKEMQEEICKNALQILNILAEQGHSGFSIGYLMNMLKKLVRFEPLTPLKGTDNEWFKLSGEGPNDEQNCWQNKRCSRVFKDNTHAWDIDGKVFRYPNGTCYTSGESKVEITFPYTPKTEYIDVPFDQEEQ